MERVNPYIGPRAFKHGEVLYGRDHEIENLLDFIVTERIVLVYSPSGAGKTSLIQAALIPQLKKEDFYILPIARVGLDLPLHLNMDDIKNQYVFSTLCSIEEKRDSNNECSIEELARMNFSDYISMYTGNNGQSEYQVLFFDQFEEIFTKRPTNINEKKDFFIQLGKVLNNHNLWAVFALREEFLAGFDPFLRYVPTHFNNRFYLKLLDEMAAQNAIQQPAEDHGVTFTDTAVRRLIDDLRRVWVQSADGKKKEELGLFIEPVQLQVTCQEIWNRLPKDQDQIKTADITHFGDVDHALSQYYDEKIVDIAIQTNTREKVIRDWFEHQLITPQGIRRDVLKGENESHGLDNKVIEVLEDKHIIRGEHRRGFTWYELAHDRLIDPVRSSNVRWFEKNLSPLQKSAGLWEKQGRPSNLLLQGKALKNAIKWARKNSNQLIQRDHEFLKKSKKKRVNQRRFLLFKYATFFTLTLSLIIVSYMAHQQWLGNRPWGYFLNLSTGTSHKLNGHLATIGRSVKGIHNSVDLRPMTISRMHLFLSRELTALDMRSRNGTTLNSLFLPYGVPHTLKNEDILVLAGLAPFRFFEIQYHPFQFWEKDITISITPSGWGIFIDGHSKQITYLKNSIYYLSMDDSGRYILLNQKTPKALLILRYSDIYSVDLEDIIDENVLRVTMKEGDYAYNAYDVPSGKRYDQFLTTEPHDIFECAYQYGKKPFQIIFIHSDLEKPIPPQSGKKNFN